LSEGQSAAGVLSLHCISLLPVARIGEEIRIMQGEIKSRIKKPPLGTLEIASLERMF
jgi:hypothetical protein